MLAEAKERRYQIAKMKRDRPNLYAYIMSKITPESEQELKRHQDWQTILKEKDPLELCDALLERHLMPRVSGSKIVLRRAAFNEFAKCKQGPFKS